MRAVAECRTKLSERPMGLQMRRLLTALRLLLAGCGDKAGNGRALFMVQHERRPNELRICAAGLKGRLRTALPPSEVAV
jgi:hypothetical protein